LACSKTDTRQQQSSDEEGRRLLRRRPPCSPATDYSDRRTNLLHCLQSHASCATAHIEDVNIGGGRQCRQRKCPAHQNRRLYPDGFPKK